MTYYFISDEKAGMIEDFLQRKIAELADQYIEVRSLARSSSG